MKAQNTTTIRASEPESGFARLFTIDSANRALVLVRRVVRDLVDRYAELMALRAKREDLARQPGGAERLEDLDRAVAQRADIVRGHLEELEEVGCELKDFSNGLVDFPTFHDGRTVYLCWRLGEDTVQHWHELETGFAGRQAIDPSFAAK